MRTPTGPTRLDTLRTLAAAALLLPLTALLLPLPALAESPLKKGSKGAAVTSVQEQLSEGQKAVAERPGRSKRGSDAPAQPTEEMSLVYEHMSPHYEPSGTTHHDDWRKND